MDRFLRELHNGAGFDVAPGVDVVANAGGGGAKGLALAVVIGIDDHNRLLGTHLDDELPGLRLLFRSQTQVGPRVRAHRPIDVEPAIHDTHFDQAVNPFLAQQVVEIRPRQAGADAGEDAVVQTILNALHGLTEHAATTAALVTDDLSAFDRDQRRYVA